MYAKNIVPKKSRIQVLEERRKVKEELSAQLERGDLSEIHRQICQEKSIAYNNVSNALNPTSQFWSPRVIAFATEYVKAKASEDVCRL